MKFLQIIDKCFGKQSQTGKIPNIFFFKMKLFDIFDGLFQTCGNGIAVSAGVVSVKKIEYNFSFVRTCFKITLHHGQLIQVRQQRQISTFHFKFSFFRFRPRTAEKLSERK